MVTQPSTADGQVAIDYRDLLCRYIEHVASLEGTTFIRECQSEPHLADVLFTPREIDELRRLANEAPFLGSRKTQ